MTSILERAGRWFLESGIQEPSGGVARYYRSDLGANVPVSTEITGYAISALTFLHGRTKDSAYLEGAIRSARYLVREAWDASASTIPFEPASDRAFFFDVGIIVRGLLATWRTTKDAEFLERGKEAALSLAFDFLGEGEFHPVISLPDKQPLPYEPRWSRQPGCYQLKSALAWREVGDACRDENAQRMFEMALQRALASHASFLPGEKDQERVMDRLHAYCYFLEALLWVSDRPDVRKTLAEGVARTAVLLREIAPVFERSDVLAQLLRIRLVAHHQGALALDEVAAVEEAEGVAAFQITGSADPHLEGGFWFGRKGSSMLAFANPVSTAFAMQALALWEDHRAANWQFRLRQLI